MPFKFESRRANAVSLKCVRDRVEEIDRSNAELCVNLSPI